MWRRMDYSVMKLLRDCLERVALERIGYIQNEIESNNQGNDAQVTGHVDSPHPSRDAFETIAC